VTRRFSPPHAFFMFRFRTSTDRSREVSKYSVCIFRLLPKSHAVPPFCCLFNKLHFPIRCFRCARALLFLLLPPRPPSPPTALRHRPIVRTSLQDHGLFLFDASSRSFLCVLPYSSRVTPPLCPTEWVEFFVPPEQLCFWAMTFLDSVMA